MSLLVWHNFQKGDATIVHDYSTNKKHSTSATAITIVAGSLGNAGRFNGTTSQLNFGDVADASGTDLLTILLRLKFDVVNVLQGVVFNNGEYSVKLLATGKIEFTIWTTGAAGGPKTLQSTTVLSINTLYNIVCRYNGTNMKIYLNGVEDATAAQTGDLATAANNLLYGSDGTNNFDGDLEVVVIRNDALGDGSGGSLNEIGAWGANPHGLRYKHYDVHSLETGDLISTGQYDAAGGKNMVVTLKEDTKIIRGIPISGKINFSETPVHRGNIFDAARQVLSEMTIVSGSPQIAFYKAVDTFILPSSSLKIDKDGVLENGSGYVLKSGSLTQITTRSHADLQNLTADNHTQYALLAGRSGGQTFIGGTGTTDKAIIRATSGVGTTGADIIFQVGNNGATEAMRILNSGLIGIRGTPTTALLEIFDNAATGFHLVDTGLAHGMTTLKPTNVHSAWQRPGSAGGTIFYSLSGSTPAVPVLEFYGASGQTSPSQPIITFSGAKKSGTTIQALAATEKLVQFANGFYPIAQNFVFTILGNGSTFIGGSTAPTATLHIKAGVAAASGAPLKFTAGTLNTAVELGAVEFTDNGTTGKLYIVVNVAGVLTRKEIAFV